ncbi:hypothetical protein NQZ68_027887 [Dissostichus eleginoides]|nr:hypothetical protein NQZ68_027887 [Dissostichus eleginoides]
MARSRWPSGHFHGCIKAVGLAGAAAKQNPQDGADRGRGLHWCQPDFDKAWLRAALYKEKEREMIKAPDRQRRENEYWHFYFRNQPRAGFHLVVLATPETHSQTST